MTAGSPPVRAAALIRADIREAAADGTLGVLPDGISFSVRAHDFAKPWVTVTVYGAGEWIGKPSLTPEGAVLNRKLLEIMARRAPDIAIEVQILGLESPDEETVRLIEEEVAGITDEHIEEQLQKTLRRAGFARGDIPGRPKRKRKG